MSQSTPSSSSAAPLAAPDQAPLAAALRRLHRSVLALIAGCALSIVIHGFAEQEPPPDPLMTTTGVGLGLVAVVLRRFSTSLRPQPRTALAFAIGSLIASALLALLGVLLAWRAQAPESGLMFTLAAAIFSIRPPQRPVSKR